MNNMIYTIILLVALVLGAVWVANNISSTENLPLVNGTSINEEITDEVTNEVVVESEDEEGDDPLLNLDSLQNDLEDMNLGDIGELPL